MDTKKDNLKGLSQAEIKFLLPLATIFVQSLVKQFEEQNLRSLDNLAESK